MTTIVILTCKHEKDYTNRSTALPKVGDRHACYSACDKVPTRHPEPRYVMRVEHRP